MILRRKKGRFHEVSRRLCGMEQGQRAVKPFSTDVQGGQLQINKGCGKHTKYFWLMLSHLLIDGMFVSPPPNSPWNLIPKVLVFGRGTFGRWWGHEGSFTNMTSWKRPQRPSQPFHHGRTQQTDGHLWTRKGPHQTFYQRLDPGLSSLQNCETVVYTQTT